MPIVNSILALIIIGVNDCIQQWDLHLPKLFVPSVKLYRYESATSHRESYLEYSEVVVFLLAVISRNAFWFLLFLLLIC